MTAPHHTRIATVILSKARPEAGPVSPPSAEVRIRAIKAIEKAIVERARARQRVRLFGVLGAAAAVALAGVGIAAVALNKGEHLADSGPVLHPEGEGVLLVGSEVAAAHDGEDGATLGSGNRLVVRPQGRAMLSFATGTEIVLEERCDLTLVDQGVDQRLALGGGSLSAKVAKLAPGRRFRVATGDAEIEVRGTQFKVSVVPADPNCGGGTTTRVDVSEGQVVVRHAGAEIHVGPGERWPSGCDAGPPLAPSSVPLLASAPPPSVAPSEPRRLAVIPPPPAPPPPAPPPPAPTSQLADQNNLFAEGLAQRRAGNNGVAAATFERFLATYPASPLTESAMAERMKLVRSRAAAQQYLARYPNGFARGDAQAIVSGHP